RPAWTRGVCVRRSSSEGTEVDTISASLGDVAVAGERGGELGKRRLRREHPVGEGSRLHLQRKPRPVILEQRDHMIGKLTPIVRYEKGHAFAFLQAVGSGTVQHQGAASAQSLDALDLKAGPRDLGIDDHVSVLILAGQLRIRHASDVEYPISASVTLLGYGADDAQSGVRNPGENGRPGLGDELA